MSSRHKPKAKWTAEEDRQLSTAVNIYGTDNWSNVANFVLSRNEKQCKERWTGLLSPNTVKAKWSFDEDNILTSKQLEFGNKWTLISTFLPGRSATNVKNRWNKLKRKQSSFPDPEKSTENNSKALTNNNISINILKTNVNLNNNANFDAHLIGNANTRIISKTIIEEYDVKETKRREMSVFPSLNDLVFDENFAEFQRIMLQ